MPRKPADSAYILALTLRKVWIAQQKYMQNVYEYNEQVRKINEEFAKSGLSPVAEHPEDDCVLWREVLDEIDTMKDLSEKLAMVTDADYRAVIFDAIKQPFNKVRGSKGFTKLVPVLETIRRYGPIDKNQPMDLTEEEARDFADLVWAQEMAPFIDAGRGVDPINKQIIAKKVATELRQFNIKYLGEQILAVEFDDVELDTYTEEHGTVLAILKIGIEAAHDIFNYDPAASTKHNFTFVRQSITMYNTMFEKEMDDEKVDDLTRSIIGYFEYVQRLIE